MFFQLDDAGAVRDDHRNTVVIYFFFNDLDIFLVVLWQRDDVADVFRLDAETFADAADLVVCRRWLTTILKV